MKGAILSASAAITEYYRLGGLNNLYSHGFGGWEVQDQGAS